MQEILYAKSDTFGGKGFLVSMAQVDLRLLQQIPNLNARIVLGINLSSIVCSVYIIMW